MTNETVFIAVSQIKVNTAVHLLQEAGINAHVINKMDSAHANLFGVIQIIVPSDVEAKAREILVEAEIL
jgi:hypothetical protein